MGSAEGPTRNGYPGNGSPNDDSGHPFVQIRHLFDAPAIAKKRKRDPFDKEAIVWPSFPKSLYRCLPSWLADLANGLERAQRDVFTASLLGVLSAALPNVVLSYGYEELSPNLFVIILAPAASGKGRVTDAIQLVEGIDDELRLQTDADMREHQEMRESGHGARNPVKERFLLASGDTTRAALIDALADNPQGLLLATTELDTLSGANSRDYGRFSDILRKSFHHERISESRRGRDVRRLVVRRPRLAVVAAGTPDQYHRLVGDLEDGLASRLAVFRTHAWPEWISPRPTAKSRQRSNQILAAQEVVTQIWQILSKRKSLLRVEFPVHVWDDLDETFGPILEGMARQYAAPESIHAFIKRAGVIAARVMSILAVYHAFVKNIDLGQIAQITVSENIAQAALQTTQVFLSHSIFNALDNLSRGSKNAASSAVLNVLSRKHRIIWELLPDESFTASELLEKIRKSVPPAASKATLYRALDQFVSQELLRYHQGNYWPTSSKEERVDDGQP